MRRLLTAREVADMWGVEKTTILRRWRAGEIPGFRLDTNVVRFDPDELDRWLEAKRQGNGERSTEATP